MPPGYRFFVRAILETTGGHIQVVVNSSGAEHTCFSPLSLCLRSLWALLSFSAAFDFPIKMWKTWTSPALICFSMHTVKWLNLQATQWYCDKWSSLVKKMKIRIKSKLQFRCVVALSFLFHYHTKMKYWVYACVEDHEVICAYPFFFPILMMNLRPGCLKLV